MPSNSKVVGLYMPSNSKSGGAIYMPSDSKSGGAIYAFK